MASHFCRSFFSFSKTNSQFLHPTINKFSPNKNLFRNYVDSSDPTKTEVKSDPLEEQVNAKLAGDLGESPSDGSFTTTGDNKNSLEIHPFKLVDAVPIKKGLIGWQPTSDTHSKYHLDGVPYEKLPIVNIKATPNNTIMTLTDYKGLVLFTTSAGCNGFKNAKKGTAVAGQATGLILGDNLKRRGIENVRVQVKGFGNGRLPSIKALQMNKLNVVSITDITPIPMAFSKAPRPPAKRRI